MRKGEALPTPEAMRAAKYAQQKHMRGIITDPERLSARQRRRLRHKANRSAKRRA